MYQYTHNLVFEYETLFLFSLFLFREIRIASLCMEVDSYARIKFALKPLIHVIQAHAAQEP